MATFCKYKCSRSHWQVTREGGSDRGTGQSLTGAFESFNVHFKLPIYTRKWLIECQRVLSVFLECTLLLIPCSLPHAGPLSFISACLDVACADWPIDLSASCSHRVVEWNVPKSGNVLVISCLPCRGLSLFALSWGCCLLLLLSLLALPFLLLFSFFLASDQ